MKHYNIKISSVIIIILMAMVTNCKSPMETDLFKQIQEAVEADRIGTAPNIQLFISDQEIFPGDSSDAFLDAVQGVPFDVQFTIKNTGTGDLALRETEPIGFSGADYLLFEVLTVPSRMVITPGSEATFTVRFTLDESGEKSTQIAVYSNDPDNNPFSFTVTNTALPEIQVLIDGNVVESGGSYQFLDVQYGGESLDVTVEIKNIGNAALGLIGTPAVTATGDSFSVQSQPTS
ncbi:MAG: choice-of-anchor D domain-containing protein, partial [Methanosarcinaceae archaeon]|nr:choice-of-anchor D domain-containing protein [Methanosarcinaceae archaeon]